MASSPLSIEERRRRRDQKLAVEAATNIVQQAAAERRVVSLEWAAVTVLLAAGAAVVLAAWHRGLPPIFLGTAGWIGLVTGAFLVHIALQRPSARLGQLGIALFLGIPLAAIPLRFFEPARPSWPAFAVTAAGAAIFGGAARWMVLLWRMLGTLRENLSALGQVSRQAAAAVGVWLHDAVIKALAALIFLVAGGALVYAGRLQQREPLIWAGLAVICLSASTGMWSPGLFKRTALLRGIRHCGQMCFWVMLLLTPFVELSPAGSLPYVARPSLRFALMGLGLVIAGGSWALQRSSIFGAIPGRPRKGALENGCALLVLVVGLILGLAGANAYQRVRVTVDQRAVSEIDMVGGSSFQPLDQVRALEIVQPVDRVPIYIEYLQFTDGHSYTVYPFLYPGDQYRPDSHGLVQAIRLAASLTAQTFPESRIELWSRAAR